MSNTSRTPQFNPVTLFNNFIQSKAKGIKAEELSTDDVVVA